MINNARRRILKYSLIDALALTGETGLTQNFAPVADNVSFDQLQAPPYREPDTTVDLCTVCTWLDVKRWMHGLACAT